METTKTAVPNWVLPAVLGVLFVLSLVFVSYGNYAGGASALEMVANTLLVSVPLALLYGSISLLMTGWQKHRQGQIDKRLASLIYWTPRIAGVLITLFVGMFAFDTFGEGIPFWQLMLGFLIHLLPAIVLAVILALAWRWELVGFLAFLLAGLFFLTFAIGNPIQGLGMILLFSGPMLVIALLFGQNWRWHDELRVRRKLA